MTTRDELWREYVAEYDVEVPEERIENELAFIELDLRHRMQYDRLTGGADHFFPGRELAAQEEGLRAAAMFEAKAPLVLKELIAKLSIEVSHEELEAEAKAMAERQNSSVEAIKYFFGDDLSMLRRDCLERKAIDWAVSQIS